MGSPRSIEELDQQTQADPSFTSMSQADQDAVFAELAKPIESAQTSHPIASFLAPLVGAIPGGVLGGAIAGSVVEPGIGTAIGAMLGSGLGAAGGEAAREHLQGEDFQPKRLLATGAGYGLFPAGAEYGGEVASLLSEAPALGRFLPQNIGKAGTVLNAAIRAASGSVAGRTGAGVLTGEEPSQTRAALLPAAGFGAVTGGAMQALLPSPLGGNNFWEAALNQNRKPISALQQGAEQETAMASDWMQSEQTRIQREAQPKLEALSAQQQIAQKGLLDTSRKVTFRVRQDMTQRGLLRQMGNRAWAPATTLERVITDRIDPRELGEAVGADPVVANDPALLQQTNAILTKFLQSKVLTEPVEVGMEGETAPASLRYVALESLPPKLQQEALTQVSEQGGVRGGKAGLTGKDLIALSRELGQKLPDAVKAKLVPSDAGDLPFHIARNAIASVIEKHTPAQYQGAFAQAKANWAKFYGDSVLAHKLIRPGTGTYPDPEPFAGLLRKIVEDLQTTGTTTENIGFVKRMAKELGYNPLDALLPYANRLRALPGWQAMVSAQVKDDLARAQEVFQGRKAQAQEQIREPVSRLQSQASTARRVAQVGLLYPLMRALRGGR